MNKVFTDSEKSTIEDMINQGKSYSFIAKATGHTKDSISGFATRHNLSNKKQTIDCDGESKEKVAMLSNGDMVFEGIIELLKGEPITPEIIMKAHNLDTTKWKVVNFVSNAWQAQKNENTKTTLWQSKITVREKNESTITFNDIDNYFANKTNSICREPLKPFAYNISDEVLEIDYADLHIGLLAWRRETGADFDLDIIEKRFRDCVADTISRCKGRKFKKIYLVTLGDILHIDNDKNETTAGTLQQADGRMAKIYDRAVDMMIDCIDTLLTLKTPIEYIYVCGNHDRNTGYYLVKSLQLAYKGNPNIMFDTDPNPLKARLIGVNLVGWNHGEPRKKNLNTVLQETFREEFGKSKFAELHCGHLHSESTQQNCGVLIKHLPSLCESSYWEHKEGYSTTRGTMCFVWNEETGLRETWYNYI